MRQYSTYGKVLVFAGLLSLPSFGQLLSYPSTSIVMLGQSGCSATSGTLFDFSQIGYQAVAGDSLAGATCPDGLTASAMGSALSLGGSLSQPAGDYTTVEAQWRTYLTFGNAPAGGPLTAQFVFSPINGSFTGDTDSSGVLQQGDFLAASIESLDPTVAGETPLCVAQGLSTCATYAGVVNADSINSNPFSVISGQTYYFLETFYFFEQCISGTCTADFPDPELKNIIVTDPTTGLAVSGVTVTGSDGAIYPVNASASGSSGAVPESGSAATLGFGLLVVAFVPAVRKRVLPCI